MTRATDGALAAVAEVDRLVEEVADGALLGHHTGLKVNASIEYPKWTSAAGLKPEEWIEDFHRFCKFQNDGLEPEPSVEVQLLLQAVPDDTVTGRKFRLR